MIQAVTISNNPMKSQRIQRTEMYTFMSMIQ